jgi:TonB dependent receptor-like, beta-barrel/TonB-dependent Receptor Plug Domain
MKNQWMTLVALICAVTVAMPLGAAEISSADADELAKESESEATVDHEHDDPGDHGLKFYEAIDVSERRENLMGIAGSANEGTTGREDLERRPKLRAGELVETVPGAIATQHSGGGKANQYFLRGFNLDHGTDFAVSVAGMPVNMPTHGHGQGYADLNFLIPELVERARYRKGPYFAEVGDFSSAGGVDFDLVRSIPEGAVSLTLGSFDFQRAMVAGSLEAAGGHLTGALEYYHYDGPWERPDDYGRWNGYLGYARGDVVQGWSVAAMGSDGEWLATDQIPNRAVEEGLVDRYGLIDPGPRGSTSRYSVSGEVHHGSESSLTSLSGYAINYDFDLFSNFTYFLDDPENGDQFEQVDDRWIYGLDLDHRWSGHLGARHHDSAVGLDLRYDDIANGLYRTSDLVRTFTTREDNVRQIGGGLWGETWIALTPELRLNLGLRADYYRAEVDAFREVNSGSADAWMLNPKFSVVWRPWASAEFSFNAGSGFHSNDARGATIRVDPTTGEPVEAVDPLVRATGFDAGLRVFTPGGYHGTVTAFWLELDSELLFVGDAGITEPSRPSRRVGIEWTNVWQISRFIGIDLDVTLTDAEFTDDDPAGDEIPGAIVATIASGITLSDLGRWSASLRLRYFSGGPLIEDGSVDWGPTVLVNGMVGFQASKHLRLALEGFNLLNRKDDDIAYYYASRLNGEPAEGIEDIHFHPMEKPSVRVTAMWQF